ncbi:Altered inheritance of mitochondria protein [Penicillium oxalicum]|uniref:Altered inheritance of mitochondria protein n=1 Tax=Penicillium oxalicum TaxID=69781 RepID=UPI0020B79374|nr:Altered inheritance of mitochondria protein [Penicillium oxalicum]KAI2790596.1 Altered inheritance of mitochondria protein [Penicillium oxalicum]
MGVQSNFSPLSPLPSESSNMSALTDRPLSEIYDKEDRLCPAAEHRPSRRFARFKTQFDAQIVGKKKALRNRIFLALFLIVVVGGVIVLIWFSLVLALIHRLTPSNPSNGLQKIVDQWDTPSDSVSLLTPWPKDFSQGIVPVSCHSHNDYWRSVPLYEALAGGCTGVEADVWLDGKDLLVGHRKNSLSPDRTLNSLYIEPLSIALSNLNHGSSASAPVGLFNVDPSTTVTLLIDIKSDPMTTWPVLHDQLSPLIAGGWLSHWNGTSKALVRGPITVVGTGNTHFDQVVADHDRYIFFDAPLPDLSHNSSYGPENSYYASVSLKKAVGTIWLWGPTADQQDAMQEMIRAAADRGLVSRFWSTPSWPVSLRLKVWRFLAEHQVGMLNVDNIVEATRWNWDWCIVAGLVLC